LAPLTGIAFAINWMIGKLNLKIGFIKTTRMTTLIVRWFYVDLGCYEECSKWLAIILLLANSDDRLNDHLRRYY